MNIAGSEVSELSRENLGRKIMEISSAMRDGYLRAPNQFSSDVDREKSNAAANAASNTGYFILEALGYSKDEIKAFRAGYEQA